MEIPVTVREKHAAAPKNAEIVCGNSDISLRFDFDSAWDAYPLKTLCLRYESGGVSLRRDIVFSGDSVALPAVYNTHEISVGVYAGNIRTTTPARIPCGCCITDGESVPYDPPPDVYSELLDFLSRRESAKRLLSDGVLACEALKSAAAYFVPPQSFGIAAFSPLPEKEE